MASEFDEKDDVHIYEHDLYYDSHALIVEAKDVEKYNEKISFVDVLKAVENWDEFECGLNTLKETVKNVSSNINKAKTKTTADLKVSIQNVSVKPKDDLNMEIYNKDRTTESKNYIDSKDGQTSIPITLLIKYCLSNKERVAKTKEQTQKDIKRCMGLCDLNDQSNQKDDSQSSFESNHMDSSSSNVNLNSYKNPSSLNKSAENCVESCNTFKFIPNKNLSEFHDYNKLSNFKQLNNDRYLVEERPTTDMQIHLCNDQSCYINLKSMISVASNKSIETIKECNCSDLNQFPPQQLCYGFCEYKNASPYSNSVNHGSQCMCRRNDSAKCLNGNGNFNMTTQSMNCQRSMSSNANQISNMENIGYNNSNCSNRTKQNMNFSVETNHFFKTLNNISYGNMENPLQTRNESSYLNRVYGNDVPDNNNCPFSIEERSSSDSLDNVNVNEIQLTHWTRENASNAESELSHPQQNGLKVNVFEKNENAISPNNTGCCQCSYVSQSKTNLINSTFDVLRGPIANSGQDQTDAQWCHCQESNYQTNRTKGIDKKLL